MIKYLVVIGLLWIGGLFGWGPDLAEYYQLVTTYTSEHRLVLLLAGTTSSVCFVLIAFALREFSMFSLMYLFSRLFFELAQLKICFISVTAVVLVFKLQSNIWLDLNVLSVVPFEFLLASCLSLYLFDFNYPLGEKLLDNITLPVISFLIAFFAMFI